MWHSRLSWSPGLILIKRFALLAIQAYCVVLTLAPSVNLYEMHIAIIHQLNLEQFKWTVVSCVNA